MFSYSEFDWSPQLFGVELCVILIGRGFGSLGLVYLFKCCRYDAGLTIKELIFIWYAGMIRGAIAFGLVLRISGSKFDNKPVIVTTSLCLVIFTTVFCGSTVGMLQRCLWPEGYKQDDENKVESKETKEIGEDTKETPLL